MSETDVQHQLRLRFGLRLGPEMAGYVLRQLDDRNEAAVPVIAGDARTGVAVRTQLPAEDLRAAIAPTSIPQP